MFKSFITASVFSVSLAGVALAGSPQPVEVSAVSVASPHTTNRGGFYIGGQVSASTGTGTYYENGVLNTSLSGTLTGKQLGVFAGYNFNVGSFVLGGEAAYSKGQIAFDAFPAYYVDNMLDLKLRAGKSFGPVLVYGVVGGSFASYTRNTFETLSSSGFSYGAGVDYQVSDRVFVGLEYLSRDIMSVPSTVRIAPKTTYRQVLGSVQLRVGMRF